MEAPYLVDMFENLTYDTIYHEHLSFLAIRPLKFLFEQFGLEIFDVQVNEVQGRSLRFLPDTKVSMKTPAVEELINKELSMGLDKIDAYEKLAQLWLNRKKI